MGTMKGIGGSRKERTAIFSLLHHHFPGVNGSSVAAFFAAQHAATAQLSHMTTVDISQSRY